MNHSFMLLFVIVGLMTVHTHAQSWFREIPADENGRLNYVETKNYVEQFRETNPYTPLKGEKQFLRSRFFLEGRILADGHLPSGIYWEEAKRVISERALYRSEQTPWQYIGPDNSTIGITSGEVGGSGRIDCITFHPEDPDLFYVGAPSGGLWKTIDGGDTWEPLTDDLPTLGISDIDLHPQNPEIIYISTGTRDVWWETFSVGILKSEDGGETWQETGLHFAIQENKAVHELWIHPQQPAIMVAATSAGLYRSDDGGDNWVRVVAGNFMDLAQKEGDPAVLFATNFSYYNCGAKIYRSTDAGLSFQVMNTGVSPSQVNRITMGTTPADPQVIYALYSACSDNSFYGLYRSNDGGDTWAETPNSTNINVLGWYPHGHDPGGQGYFTLALSVDPVDPEHVHAGGVNIWESVDGGDIWTLNAQYIGWGAQYVHADIHTLTYNQQDQSHYNTNDGGVYKYISATGDWVNISDGLHIMQFYRLGVFRGDENRILGSPQDNGTVLFTGGPVAYEIILAEACDNFFDYNQPDTLYFGGYAKGINRSYDGGESYTRITPPGESDYRFYPPFLMHPTDPAVLFCGFTDVWISQNRGTSWINLSDGLSNGADLMSLEVAPSNTDYIYAATYSSIWRTKNGGGNWESILAGLPSGSIISDISLSSVNPEHLWITLLGWANGKKVFHSTDAGDTWQNVSMNLPNLPVNCIAYEPGSQDAVYVGTDVGIYYTNANLTEWINYSQDLPNVMIDELEVHPASGKLLAATYGRGMWWNFLADPATVGIRKILANEPVVYPNPASSQIRITFLPPSPGSYTLALISLTGKTVLSKPVWSTGMEVNTLMNVGDLPAGLYHLTINGEKETYTAKVVISR